MSSRLAELSPEKRALLLKRLRQKQAQTTPSGMPRQPREPGRSYPVSFTERRLWFLHQLDPESSFYNEYLLLHLRGPLDAPRLWDALDAVTRRHEILRTRFIPTDDGPRQIIDPPRPGERRTIDLRALPVERREAAATPVIHAIHGRPFDLERGPMLRAQLIRLDDEETLLFLVTYHIVADHWAISILMDELSRLYGAATTGEPSSLPELTVQYVDFAAWEQERWRDGGERLGSHLAFWRERLAGAPGLVTVPADRPRPAAPSHRGAWRPVRIDGELLAAVEKLGQSSGATLYMTLLAVFKLLVYRLSGQVDLVVGTPTAGRGQLALEKLIGCFLNMVVMRTRLASRQPFSELLASVRETALGAFEHQEMPFEKLVEELDPERDLSHGPFFQISFNLQNIKMHPFALPGLEVEARWFQMGIAKADLDVYLERVDDGLGGLLEYATELFDATTIERLIRAYRRLLRAVVADPERRLEEVPLLDEVAVHQLCCELNDSARAWPERGLVEGLTGRAAATPSAIAVACGDRQLSYGALARRGGGLAARLRQLGIGPESRVGICRERSDELLIAIWGVLAVGGAYVPLDPHYPAERLRFMATDAGLAALLVDAEPATLFAELDVPCLSPVDDDHGAVVPGVAASAANLAYVIYTSGSTGRPKGVQISRGALLNFLLSMAEAPGISDRDVLLAVTSLSFDIAALELLGTLLQGGRIVLATLEEAADGERLAALLTASRTSVMQATPATWRLLLAAGWTGGATRILCGGEALDGELAADLLARSPVVWNLYGPTETTVWSARWTVRPGPVRIGRPIAETAIHVLDPGRRPVAWGAIGELVIGGAGLCRGYLRRPALTARVLVPDPLSGEAGARLYRTGDLARWTNDGELECLGRIDHQVKVRGFRIELGEIETRLLAAPGVRAAAVVVAERETEDPRLVAYTVLDSPMLEDSQRAGGAIVADLQSFLAAGLPAYMVPSRYVFLAELPMTPNRKVDRRALLAGDHGPAVTASPERGGGDGPRTPVEEMLAGLWSEILGTGAVGRDEDFFALGGHSLLAVRLLSRVRQVLDVELSLRDFFARATFSAMAAQIDSARRSESGSVPALTPVSREGALPLSFAQERLWLLDQITPGTAAYNLPFALRLHGELDVTALTASLGETRRRHEVLRTTYASEGGRPRQVVGEVGELVLPLLDLSALPEAERSSSWRRLSREEAERPFDLARGPLLRGLLLRLGPDEHVLLLTVHHIVADGWSMGVLVGEVSAAYRALRRGGRPSLPALSVQYADYAAWQRGWLVEAALEERLAVWRRRLQGAPELLTLPTDRPRPPRLLSRGGRLPMALPEAVSEALDALARRQSTTRFMTLLAAFSTVLGRLSGSTEVVVGTPMANRERAELEALIGFFVNPLALRIDLGDTSFTDLLSRVRAVALEAYAHQDLPFEKLVEALSPARNPAYTPLFQVMLALNNAPFAGLELSGLELQPLDVEAAVPFDLTLALSDADGVLRGAWEYRRDLFDAATIHRLARHFATLLASALAAPETRLSSLELLAPGERQQMVVEWNDTAAVIPWERCLHHVFADRADATPEAIALASGDEQLSYAELAKRSDQLAGLLVELGVGPEARVGILVERSPAMVIALLAVLGAGGAYVPLDPSFPVERLRFMVDDAVAGSSCPFLITDPSCAGLLPAGPQTVMLDRRLSCLRGRETSRPASDVDGSSLAYVIYTSGSTGRPKGVQIVHRTVINFLEAMAVRPGLVDHDTLLSVTTLSFDIFVLELFLPLMTGARLELPRRDTAADPERLAAELARTRATAMQATPTAWRLLLEVGWTPPETLTILCGGEALSGELAGRLSSGSAGLWNLYGPTETTIWSALSLVPAVEDETASPSIGRPLANNRLLIVDRQLMPLPIGVVGELLIGGEQLARGYLGRPALTAVRFLPDFLSPRAGERLYRTGDLARFLPDGRVEVLGRLDHQVKIRGFRIELGEIEAVLRRQRGVADTVVVAWDDGGAERRLVAYLATGEEVAPSPSTLRSALLESLPSYMIPSAWVMLAELPTTPNGKLDRSALPSPEDGPRQLEASFRAPGTELEQVLAEVFQDVLGRERIGLDDNFFELGGNSADLVRVGSRLRDRLAGQLTDGPRTVDLFTYPTLGALAEYLASRTSGQAPVPAPVVERDAELRTGRDRMRQLRRQRQRAQ